VILQVERHAHFRPEKEAGTEMQSGEPREADPGIVRAKP
jgi:hypothetical protein